ncbi:putative 28S ribosomal protein S21, mitochondrial [Hypsibius exemplaris]|uniref:28S ribosomal protein S21, mitochondrial n=1 Tax=Hypsibius exemplaris TaxID=2072580 RepID=A0A1W0WBQ7_HYPEX|nr:putative 28S ribosomal protein S21, mitochondrial [Hypsibius exemplaris]
MSRHMQFFARTVMVRNGQVDEAVKALNRICGNENIFEIARRRRYNEKPYKARNRISYELCKRIYNDDMSRKIQFLMRKNRVDPWQGT